MKQSAWEAPYKFDVETGRGDSYEPHASEVIDLPPPTATASDSIQAFQKKGLTVTDMVYLLGICHKQLFFNLSEKKKKGLLNCLAFTYTYIG